MGPLTKLASKLHHDHGQVSSATWNSAANGSSTFNSTGKTCQADGWKSLDPKEGKLECTKFVQVKVIWLVPNSIERPVHQLALSSKSFGWEFDFKTFFKTILQKCCSVKACLRYLWKPRSAMSAIWLRQSSTWARNWNQLTTWRCF